jgi:transposase
MLPAIVPPRGYYCRQREIELVRCLKPVKGHRKVDLKYLHQFKSKMVQRLSCNNAQSANALSRDVGVPQATLSRWLRNASVVQPERFQDSANALLKERSSKTTMTPKSPKDWTPEEKLLAVLEASQLSQADLGAYLRQKGQRESSLKQWRQEMIGGLQSQAAHKKAKGKSEESRRIQQLERELHRKDKALAETAALLVLKKKPRRSGGTRTTALPRRTGNDPGYHWRSYGIWSPSFVRGTNRLALTAIRGGLHFVFITSITRTAPKLYILTNYSAILKSGSQPKCV